MVTDPQSVPGSGFFLGMSKGAIYRVFSLLSHTLFLLYLDTLYSLITIPDLGGHAHYNA